MRLHPALPVLTLAGFGLATNPRLLSRDKPLIPAGKEYIEAKLTIINATPYRFSRFGVNSFHVNKWDITSTPAGVDPGKSATFQYYLEKNYDDAGADLAYCMVIDDRCEKRFNIHLNPTDSGGYRLMGSVHGGLNTAGHGSDQGDFTFVDYGYNAAKPGNSDFFILAGDEKLGYSTVAPPTAWMDAMGPDFKKLALKDIAMPSSHDAGANHVHGGFGGVRENTETQDVDINSQLFRGVRMFDIRVALNSDGFQLGHFSGVGGMYGQSVYDMIENINRFNRDYPGELIILDMTDGDTFKVHYNTETRVRDFNEDEMKEFLDILEFTLAGVKTEYTLTTNDPGFGIAAEPLNTFFRQNRSPVIVRLPATVRDPRVSRPGGKTFTGLISKDLMPFNEIGAYSNTPDVSFMRSDQQRRLNEWDGKGGMFKGVYTLTGLGFIELGAFSARDVIYEYLWSWCSKSKYPNFIQFDYVKDSQVAALSMAINSNFALSKLPR